MFALLFAAKLIFFSETKKKTTTFFAYLTKMNHHEPLLLSSKDFEEKQGTNQHEIHLICPLAVLCKYFHLMEYQKAKEAPFKSTA